jgi:hypothetical protein
VSAGSCKDCGGPVRSKRAERCGRCAARINGRRGAEARWSGPRPAPKPKPKRKPPKPRKPVEAAKPRIGLQRRKMPEGERRERMALIEAQVAAGTLVIRQATPAERRAWLRTRLAASHA